MEVAYVLAGRLITRYQDYCEKQGIEFSLNRSLKPPDSTTLFCSSGMQRLKPLFSDQLHTGTIANVQSCLRLVDLDEIGDSTHFLYFKMIGLFSFRQLTVKDAIDFWLGFLDHIGLPVDYVTIHPDKIDEWSPLYEGRVTIRPDPECMWSDGNISGYCTEFYSRDVEIGNIVNPLGTCIDVGFGLERIDMLLNGTPKPDANVVLSEAITTIIDSGYTPGNKEQGYVLRKLLRKLHKDGGYLDHPFFSSEVDRQNRLKTNYERLLRKNSDKTPEWWFDTHGIDVKEM